MKKKRELPLGRVYQLLETGPVVLLTTSHRGKANVMTQSWHTMIDFLPPIIGLIVSNRNHSFEAVKATRECVINIPTARIAKAVVGCGNTSGRDTDKFRRFGLTAVPAAKVKAPLIAECYASIECRVLDMRMADLYNLFVVEGLKAWVDPAAKDPKTLHHRGYGTFMVAGRSIKLPSRMK